MREVQVDTRAVASLDSGSCAEKKKQKWSKTLEFVYTSVAPGPDTRRNKIRAIHLSQATSSLLPLPPTPPPPPLLPPQHALASPPTLEAQERKPKPPASEKRQGEPHRLLHSPALMQSCSASSSSPTRFLLPATLARVPNRPGGVRPTPSPYRERGRLHRQAGKQISSRAAPPPSAHSLDAAGDTGLRPRDADDDSGGDGVVARVCDSMTSSSWARPSR